MIEHSIIGALLTDETAYDRVADRLHAEMFSDSICRQVYSAIDVLANTGKPVDVVTVLSWLDDRGDWTPELAQEIGELARSGVARNLSSYVDSLIEQNQKRALVELANHIAERVDEGATSGEIRGEIESRLDRAERGGDAVLVKDLITRVVDDLDARFNAGGGIVGLSTGYPDLDQIMSGLQKTDLIILAARPSMGKTTLALNIAENVSASAPVQVFSMEMSDKQLTERSICSMGRINFGNFRSGNIHDDEWPCVTSGVSKLSERKLFIDDTPALTINAIRSRARRMKRKHGLGLIVVDYLQLMQAKGETRAQAVGSISRGLKSIAKELDVPVLALSQLNRGLETRPNKRPVLADLRESGDIEQDADVVMFIYRDEVYNEDTPDRGVAEIIFAKQRNAVIGTRKLTFMGKYCRFENFVFRDEWAGPMEEAV